MKINFQFVTALSSVGVNLVAAQSCDTADLPQPENWKEWDCALGGKGALVETTGPVIVNTNCFLGCKEGFTSFSARKRNFYKCRNQGWHPVHLDLSCKYDRKSTIIRELKFENIFSFLLDSFVAKRY